MKLHILIILALVAIVASLEGQHRAWDDAHRTVARECNKLGAFYVGTEVFNCSLRSK